MQGRSETNASDAAPAGAAPASQARRERASRPRRWGRRIIVSILLVIVLAIGAAQVILWSDFPRRVVARTLERQLGLKIDARSLSTGWFGSTTLRDVHASLPLTDETFLTMPRLHVRHTSLVRMIFGATLDIERIELRQPELILRQYPSGRWNVQDAADVIARATRRPPDPTARPRRITSDAIPELRIAGATIRFIDRRQNESRVEPLNLTGVRDGPLLYRVDAAVPQRLAIEGQIVPGVVWQHQFELTAQQPDDWLRPIIKQLPQETQVEAQWRGQIRDGGLVGRAELMPVRADDRSARGFVAVETLGGVVTLHPQNLQLETGMAAAPQVRVDSGTIVIDGPSIRADAIRLSGAGGNAEFSGAWDTSTDQAELRALWNDLVLGDGVTQTGSFTGTLRTVFPNEPRIDATLVSTGRSTGGSRSWDALLRVSGSGESFEQIGWTARFERAFYDGVRDVNLGGLTLAATQRGPVVSLDNVELPERGRITGRGQLDFAEKHWWLWLSGAEVALPRARTPGARLAMDFNAWGTFESGRPFDYVMLDRFYLNLGDVELSAQGFYDDHLPKPVALKTWITHLPLYGEERSPIVRGRLEAETEMAGTLRPLELELEGNLRGRDLHFRRYNLGDPEARLTGMIDGRSARFYTKELRLLDANWELEGDWPVDPAKSLELIVKADAVALEKVGEVFGEHRLSGVAGARVKLLIPEPRLADLIIEDSTFEARDVAVEPFAHADRVAGSISLRDGVLRIAPVELRQGDAGAATASAHADLRSPRLWFVQFDAQQWPLDIPNAGNVLFDSAGAELRIDLAQRAAWGDVRARGNFTREGSELGTANLDLVADGRVLRLTRLEGRTLNGTYSGAGSYILDDPNRAKLLLEWRDMNAATLANWIPRLEGMSGLYNGRLAIEPTDDPRALEPLEIELTLHASGDAGYRAMSMVNLDVLAYANFAEGFDAYRLVAPAATLAVADGQAQVFARLTRREDGTLAALIDANFARLSLDQIVHAAAPDAEPMPGRLTGRLSLRGDPRPAQLRDLSGDVNLELSESDLANFDPVAFLYDLMRVGARGGEGPTGRGSVQARLDARSLQVTNFYLFNQGVEVRGAGAVENVLLIPQSPISGTFVGTARPLSALRIPFMADVDQIFAVLQANATTVRVSGTLREPQVRPTTLDEVGDAVRTLLLGDVTRQQRGGR